MIAGIDLGGTHVRLALADTDGSITATERASTRALGTPDAVVGWIADRVREGSGAPRSLAIGAPGLIDAGRRVLVDAANLGWSDVPLADLLEQAAGCPAHLENDANLAALAELHHGAGRGSRNLVYLTWSTGIGAGLVLDGRLFAGSHGLAGELGHVIVEPDGPPCGCGQRGCLEAVCGGAGLERQTGTPAGSLFAAAAKGDPAAAEAVRGACATMGRALLTLAMVLDPDAIVIGGGFAGSWDLIAPRLEGALDAAPLIRPERRPAIVPAQLGSDAGLRGAVEWARINAPPG